jgi:hypothetical protein
VCSATILLIGITAAISQDIVSWQDAANYDGQVKTVEGTIVATVNTGKVCHLNFSHKWRTDFKAVIFAEDFGKFPSHPESYYRGKHVEVTGSILDYKGRPEMILTDPSQIRILDAPATASSIPKSPPSLQPSSSWQAPLHSQPPEPAPPAPYPAPTNSPQPSQPIWVRLESPQPSPTTSQLPPSQTPQPPPSATSSEEPAPRPSAGYPALDTTRRIKNVLEYGMIVVLDDGSKWHIFGPDQKTTARWSRSTKVTVRKMNAPIFEHAHVLFNLMNNQTALAVYLGNK